MLSTECKLCTLTNIADLEITFCSTYIAYITIHKFTINNMSKMLYFCMLCKNLYCTAGFHHEEFNLVTGSIYNIKICDHFFCDIL